jgi:hypothetical protein
MRPKYGATRADGYRFWGMRPLKSGLIQEVWCSPRTWANNQRLVKKHNHLRKFKRKQNPKLAEQNRRTQWFWRAKNRTRVLIYTAKHRAHKAGLPFNLVPEDITIPKRCPVLGMKLVHNRGTVHDASPSLDKIMPALGYVRGNVIVVSRLANTIKSNATPEQILRVGAFYKRLLRRTCDHK